MEEEKGGLAVHQRLEKEHTTPEYKEKGGLQGVVRTTCGLRHSMGVQRISKGRKEDPLSRPKQQNRGKMWTATPSPPVGR